MVNRDWLKEHMLKEAIKFMWQQMLDSDRPKRTYDPVFATDTAKGRGPGVQPRKAKT